MNRRDLLYSFVHRSTSLLGLGLCSGCMKSHLGSMLAAEKSPSTPNTLPVRNPGPQPSEQSPDTDEDAGAEDLSLPEINDSEHIQSIPQNGKQLSAEEQYRILHFDEPLPNDLYLGKDKLRLAAQVFEKIGKVQKFVGHGRFNLIDLQEMLDMASSKLASSDHFRPNEIALIEELFFTDAKLYGFYGKKLLLKISDKIPSRDVIKIPGSGHYLFRDVSYPLYEKIKKDVGNSVILTSGIRGVSKQLYLFLNKLLTVNGNLSQSSRSLAPPGYSYHAVGDFDVGKQGLGGLNFTNTFSTTEEYKKLITLGYIDIRYPSDNPYGVRFEPWHIEGVEKRI